jgi:cytochrome P450
MVFPILETAKSVPEGSMTDFRFDDADQYVKGTPYNELARLRGHAPFSRQPSFDPFGEAFWLATKYHDVVSLSKNPKLFVTIAPLLSDPIPKKFWPAYPALAMIADNLTTFAPEKHDVFRVIINSLLFSGPRLAEMEAHVRKICANTLSRVSSRAQFDFACDIALPIPVEVILGTLLGIPLQDLDKITRSVLTINSMDDPIFRPNQEALLEAAEALFSYGMSILRRLKASPGEGLLSEIIHMAAAKGMSSEELFLAFWFPLIAGAFDTTASAIAGGMQGLLQFPEQMKQVCDDPGLVPAAVEEMLRWSSPVVYFRRTATADTEFDGNHIKKGDKVVLCYASANRDEDVFVEPNSFDVKRNPNKHVAFGYGSHFCMGARVALLIMRVFLEEFIPRLSGIQLDGEIIRTRSVWINRIHLMPVRNLQKGPQ